MGSKKLEICPAADGDCDDDAAFGFMVDLIKIESNGSKNKNFKKGKIGYDTS